MKKIMSLAAVLLCFAVAAAFAEGSGDPGASAETAPPSVQTLNLTVLAVGSSGEEVTRLQQRLKDLGYLSGKVDGQYGGGTRRAVIAFQRRNGLDADGIAGGKTLALLYSEDAVPVPENTDPVDVVNVELPVLVNQEHTVDEFFVPADLVLLAEELADKPVKIKYSGTRGVRTAVEALGRMLEAAKEDGLTKWQVSAAYRSWDDQVSILNAKISSYLKKNEGWGRSKARQAALRTVAEPGSSEHHLGLAFDVNVPGASSFAGTKQSAWLNEHCWDFGFIIRYQKAKEEITGYTAEPWHIRYVGEEHALYMKEHDLCLEEYLEGIENGTVPYPAEEEVEYIELTEDADE